MTRLPSKLVTGSTYGVLTHYPLTNEGVNDSSKVNRNFQDLETLLLTHTQAASTITMSATERVLGRGSAGAGAVEELVVSSPSPCGLTMAWAAGTLGIGAITDTVQLARLGLGAAPHASALLYGYTDAADGAAYADSQVILSRSAGVNVSMLSDQGEPSRLYWADGFANASIVYDTTPPGSHVELAIYHGAARVLSTYDSKVWLPTLTGPSLLAIDSGEYVVTDTTGLSPQFAGQTLRAGVGADMVTYWQADNATNNDSMWRWTVADATGTLALANNTGGTYAAHDWITVTADGTTAINTLTVTNTTTLLQLTASRLMATGAGKAAASVANLASWVAGTANRITVADDGDGTITLSAPQDIHTSATPQFARIGINAAAHLTDVLTVSGKSTFSDTIIASSTIQATGLSVGRVIASANYLLDLYSESDHAYPHLTANTNTKYAFWQIKAKTDRVVAIGAYGDGFAPGNLMGVSQIGAGYVYGSGLSAMGVGTITSAPLVLATNDTARVTIAATGAVTCSSTLQTTGLSVGAALISGASISTGDTSSSATATPRLLNLGGTYANSVGDPSKTKIRLYDDGTNIFGLGVSSASFELFAKANTAFDFYCGARIVAGILASGTATSLTLTGNEGGPAYLNLVADEGDDNGDTWRIRSDHTTNELRLQNNISGTVETKAFFDTAGVLGIPDGVTAPGSSVAGFALVYVDTADGDLKIRFADGTVKTIVTDT